MSEEKTEKGEVKKGGVLKWIARVLIVLVVLLAAHPLWLGFVAKTAANVIAPKLTGTEFRIDSLGINFYTLDFSLEGLMLGNPAPHKDAEARAAAIAKVHLDVAWSGLLSKHLLIEDFTVNEVFASYFSEDGRNNIDVILEQVCGPKKSAEKPAEPEEKPAEETAAAEPLRIKVGHLLIDGVSLKIGIVPLSVPVKIELDDIGMSSDGVTPAELGDIIVNAVANAAGNAGAALMNLGSAGAAAATEAATEAATKAADAVGSALDAVVNTDLTKDGVKATGDALKATGKQLESIGKGFKNMFK